MKIIKEKGDRVQGQRRNKAKIKSVIMITNMKNGIYTFIQTEK